MAAIEGKFRRAALELNKETLYIIDARWRKTMSEGEIETAYPHSLPRRSKGSHLATGNEAPAPPPPPPSIAELEKQSSEPKRNSGRSASVESTSIDPNLTDVPTLETRLPTTEER